MSDNNSVRTGDVSDPGGGINVKDLLHLSDVADGRTSVTANENLYELDGDSTISQEDADALYDILRGDRSAPDAINKVEFRWVYNEEHGDSFLQIKNWNGYQGFLDSGMVSEYANVYWFYENTFNALDEASSYLSLRPSVADNYPFEKNFDVDEDTHIEFILQEGVYRLYINGFPAVMYPVGDGDGVFFDDANPPVYTEGESEKGYYPVFKKSMTSFISTWEVGADSLEIELPLGDLLSGGHVNQLKIDFGDQTSVVYVNSATSGKISHTYAQAGNNEIKITGKIETWSFNNDEFSSSITNISQWGCLNLTTTTHQFDGCGNLEVTATDYPIIDDSTSLECCFQNCTSMTGGVENWKVKNVVSFEKMFNGCTNFNGDVSSWDTSSATNMVSMFMNASAFNADVNTKEIGNETAWDVSNVTDANRMFAGCTTFDQSIHEWNVGGMQDMELILNDVTLSLCNYIKIIRKWSTLAFENTNIKFGAPSCKYDYVTQSYRSILEQSMSITDGGLDVENSCDSSSVLYATLVSPSLEHINSGVDLMDSRWWPPSWDDANNQDQYEAVFVPFYDIDYTISEAFYNSENKLLWDLYEETLTSTPYLMFSVTYDNPSYNYEHTWSVIPGSTLIMTGSPDIPTLQQQYPTATIVDSLVEIDFLNTITTEKIIIPLGPLRVATIEDYTAMGRQLPTRLPNPGEHLYVYRKDESEMVNSEIIRVDTFDAEYVEANFSNFPRQMCMYVDNGLSGMMVYVVKRTSFEDRGNYHHGNDSTIEVHIKENGVWSDARKIEDVIPELKESSNTYSVNQDGKVSYCSHLKKLLLLHHNGYIWLNYDDTSNTLSYHMESDLSGGVDFPASPGSHSHGFIGVTPDMDILYDTGIRKFSGSGYSELIQLKYEIPNVGPYQGNGCRQPYIRYNSKNDTIEVTYFISVDNFTPFSGNLVCVKDSYTIDKNLRPQKVSSSTMTKKVVDETGESMYPSMFVNKGEQLENLHSDIYCMFPAGASDDVNSIYFPTAWYWYPGLDRIPIFYHNTETNHSQSFELNCDMLLYACVSHGVLITLEYDDDADTRHLHDMALQHWSNTYIRFTEINTSDPVNIQLSQIGERKNIKDMGFQVPSDYSAHSVDRTIIYGYGYGDSVGDWLSVAPNANKDIFSVLIT